MSVCLSLKCITRADKGGKKCINQLGRGEEKYCGRCGNKLHPVGGEKKKERMSYTPREGNYSAKLVK